VVFPAALFEGRLLVGKGRGLFRRRFFDFIPTRQKGRDVFFAGNSRIFDFSPLPATFFRAAREGRPYRKKNCGPVFFFSEGAKKRNQKADPPVLEKGSRGLWPPGPSSGLRMKRGPACFFRGFALRRGLRKPPFGKGRAEEREKSFSPVNFRSQGTAGLRGTNENAPADPGR